MFNCYIKALVNYAYFIKFRQILLHTLMLIFSQKHFTLYILCPICVHHAFYCVTACHFRIFLVTSYFILNFYQLGWRSSPATSHCYFSNCWKVWVCENVPLLDYVNCLKVFIVAISTFNLLQIWHEFVQKIPESWLSSTDAEDTISDAPRGIYQLILNLLLALFA